jgi:hypothetical protein
MAQIAPGDYSVAELRAILRARLFSRAAGRLQDTDHFVLRFLEVGTAIPAAVVTARAAIRAALDNAIANVAGATEQQLVDAFNRLDN